MFSNKFFRCPNFLSGLYVLSIILYLITTVFDEGNIYIVSWWIGIIGSAAWAFWCLINIYENEECYVGFDGAGGFSWLWPFSSAKVSEKPPTNYY